MKDNIKEFRDGIFALRTRRFGTVAELMIDRLYGFTESLNQFHDSYCKESDSRVEIKFSTVMKANKSTITKENVIEQCLEANLARRAMSSKDIYTHKFDCNIQQVKRDEFDILYYGLFFSDIIAIFKMTSEEVGDCPGFSNFQHKGNEGEGQFHLNQNTIQWHLDNALDRWLTYEELYELLYRG